MFYMWIKLLDVHQKLLDMSSVQLDGSQTRARQGGEAVGFQDRKKAPTTNMLFLTDKQGIPLGCSDPISGEHHDLFEIIKSMQKIIDTIRQANIDHRHLFMNADSGFDSREFRKFCDGLDIFANIDINKRNGKDPDKHDYLLDNELFKERFAIERTNAWLDGFKGLLVRYETNAKHWLGQHYMAFSVILLRKAGFKF